MCACKSAEQRRTSSWKTLKMYVHLKGCGDNESITSTGGGLKGRNILRTELTSCNRIVCFLNKMRFLKNVVAWISVWKDSHIQIAFA